VKRCLVVPVALGLVFGFSSVSSSNVEAAQKIKTYKNCTELNKDYKGGVARSSSAKNKGGKTKYKPYVSQALYDANKKSDRDKDLIACER